MIKILRGRRPRYLIFHKHSIPSQGQHNYTRITVIYDEQIAAEGRVIKYFTSIETAGVVVVVVAPP